MAKIKFQKVPNYTLITSVLLVIMAVINSVTDALGINGNMISYSKYALALICSVFGFIVIGRNSDKKGNKLVFQQEFGVLCLMMIYILLSTFAKALIHDRFEFEMLLDILRMAIPIIYSFALLNTLEYDQIEKCMRVMLFIYFIGYLKQQGFSSFTPANILSISFADSYSPFESHQFASISLLMFCFFSYYRKSKLCFFISTVFVFLTFKRAQVVFIIILLVLLLFFNLNKFISRWWVIAMVALTVGGAIAYFYILTYDPLTNYFETTFNMDFNKFTMYRNVLLNQLVDSNYESFGFTSSTIFLGHSIEMDLIKIYLEIGFLGLALTVFAYWNLTKGHLFCMIIMTQFMFNLITSHSFDGGITWTFRMLIIGCVIYKHPEPTGQFRLNIKTRYRLTPNIKKDELNAESVNNNSVL